MTLSVEVETARRERTLVLPQAALRGPAGRWRPSQRAGAAGWARPGTQRAAGLRTLDAVEVLGGLKESDTVLRGHASFAGRSTRACPHGAMDHVIARAHYGVSRASAAGCSPALTGTMGR